MSMARCRSLKLAAFVTLAGPLDLLTRYTRRSSPFDRLRVRIIAPYFPGTSRALFPHWGLESATGLPLLMALTLRVALSRR